MRFQDIKDGSISILCNVTVYIDITSWLNQKITYTYNL